MTKTFEMTTDKSSKLIESILKDFTAGIDYMTLVNGKKPTLLIPGADKLCMKFNLMALFKTDMETISVLKDMKNFVAFICELVHRETGQVVAQGRGAAQIGDGASCKTINGTIKMAEIRSKRDAVLNLFPIRDRFTQDMEDVKSEPTKMTVDQEGNVTI